MTEFEIRQLFKLAYTSKIIDRVNLKEYGGIFREVVLLSENECRIDFLDKNNKISDEGEISVYFHFESLEDMIAQLEVYTGKNLSEWKRYFTYPEIFNNKDPDWNQEPEWDSFICDFGNHKIKLPENYSDRHFRNLYWEDIYNGVQS